MNRALEFLEEAQAAFPLLYNRWGWKAKQFVDLAIDEVTELLQENADLRRRLAAFEAQYSDRMLMVEV